MRIKIVIPKLNRAIGILSKIRHYVPKFLLKTIYYSLFNSHLIYACQVWGQNQKYLEQLSNLQNKARRIINFKQHDYPVDELYNANDVLKIKDYIDLLNCFFFKTQYLMNLYQYFLSFLNDLITYRNIQHDKQPITLSKFITCIPSLTDTIQSEINQFLNGILL